MLTALDRKIAAGYAAITAPGQKFALSKLDRDGVSLPLFAHAPPDLRAYFKHSVATHGSKTLVVHHDQRWTLDEIYRRGLAVAAALQKHHGIAKGDRVALVMRNRPEWMALFIGLVELGAVVVPLNSFWDGAGLCAALRHCGARLAVADAEHTRLLFTQRMIAGQAPIPLVTVDVESAAHWGATALDALLADAPDAPCWTPPLSPDDDATIIYTSGATGTPRGAVSTHRALTQAVMNFLASGVVMRTLLPAAEGDQAKDSPAPQQAILLNVPLFHVTGAVPVFLASFAAGRKMVIMNKWDAGVALELIERERISFFVGVPTMSFEMMNHPDRPKRDLSSLVDLAVGGAARPADHVPLLARAFPGQYLVAGYGLTETNGVGAGNQRDNYIARPASAGYPSRPLSEIAIFDSKGAPVPSGQVGEIAIRSVANARGYWNDPQGTARAFRADGWFLSGDLGYLDEDGYLYIVDRKKDMIIRGGENISSQEVEFAISAHEAVHEVGVFGLPDERLGELVAAVVHAPDDGVTPESILSFVDGRIPAYKKPAHMWVSPEPLPRLGSGKIDKARLRRLYGHRPT